MVNLTKTKTRTPRDNNLRQEILQIKRVSKATTGGRSFRFGALVLVKDEKRNAIAFIYSKAREAGGAIKKASKKATKKMKIYFAKTPRTINRDIIVKFKATKILLKPAQIGSGISAGNVVNRLFKFLGIKDVSAKIIGSRNKINVINGIFQALEKLSDSEKI